MLRKLCLSQGTLKMGLPLVFGALAVTGAAAQPATALADSYRVVNLGNGSVSEKPAMNAKGQVALSMDFGGNSKALFYDGKTVHDLGNLGGPYAFAVGVNDNGQVIGYSSTDPTNAITHAFAWNKGTGMVDLGALPGRNHSTALANNNRGEVVGASASSAVRWTLASGLERLGTLGGRFASATMVNNAGLIAGWSEPPATSTLHAFVWTQETGMTDIHPAGTGGFSYPLAASNAGQVTGWSAFPGADQHAFLWTREGGMVDLAPATPSGTISVGSAISGNGQWVAGFVGPHATAWSDATGMVDLGTLGGPRSVAFGVNNQGVVVGYAENSAGMSHAFAWSAADGLVDLNGRLRDAPAGLELGTAVAVSENGAILAYSNQGVILLKPDGQDAQAGAEATHE